MSVSLRGRERPSPSAYDILKRALDVTLSAALLLLLALPLLVITLMVWTRIGAPVLFCQVRPGQDGKPFRLVKFRTMMDSRDVHGQLLPDADRLTSFGRFLRASSCDELPELWNVLKGEMSFVGPRPLLMQYLPLYDANQARRHEVLPGLTGWAQVNGRNALSWDRKFALDIWYVEHRSIWLDLKILWVTLAKVFLREGISGSGEATMAPFEGSSEIAQKGGQ